VPVAPASRATVAVHEPADGVGRDQAVAARVESTNGIGIVAERPSYFTYGGAITGAHNVVGATALGTVWYFAEGNTGPGFDEYLTILNPGNAGAATITYYVEGQNPTTRSVPLAATSRTTVTVHAPFDATHNPGGLGRLSAGHATRVTTTVPVVVERPMYFVYGNGIDGAHNVMGTTSPATIWNFAEGYTGTGFDQYFTILNPSPSQATVSITYYIPGGTVTRNLAIQPNTRATVSVHDPVQGVGRDQAVSARITSTNGVGIVAERLMYFTFDGVITGGHAALGQVP
jgi:hypothetical protein